MSATAARQLSGIERPFSWVELENIHLNSVPEWNRGEDNKERATELPLSRRHFPLLGHSFPGAPFSLMSSFEGFSSPPFFAQRERGGVKCGKGPAPGAEQGEGAAPSSAPNGGGTVGAPPRSFGPPAPRSGGEGFGSYDL